MDSLARKKLGDLLVEGGVLDKLQLSSALGFQKQWGGRLGRICVEMKFTDERTITDAVARQLGIPVVELVGRAIPPEVLAAVPQELCERFQLLPIGLLPSDRGMETLQVAMSDPTDLQVVDELAFVTGKRVEIAAATDTDVDLAIRHHFYGEAVADQLRGPTYLGHAPFAGHEVEFDSHGKDGVVVGAPLEGSELDVLELSEEDLVAEPTSQGTAVPLGRLEVATVPAPTGPVPVAFPSGGSGSWGPAAPAGAGGGGVSGSWPVPGPLSMQERLLLETLDAVAGTDGDPIPSRALVAGLMRLLVRKGVITEEELIAEFSRR